MEAFYDNTDMNYEWFPISSKNIIVNYKEVFVNIEKNNSGRFFKCVGQLPCKCMKTLFTECLVNDFSAKHILKSYPVF